MEAHLDRALGPALVEQARIGVSVACLARLLQPSVEPGDRVIGDRRTRPAARAGTACGVRTPGRCWCPCGRREIQVRSPLVGQSEYRHSGRMPNAESHLVKIRI